MLMSKTQGGVSFGFISFITICPEDRPPNALYLTPLPKPKGKVWYSKVPMGHNTLGKIISEIMKETGFEGHYTNHSLRVTSAT